MKISIDTALRLARINSLPEVAALLAEAKEEGAEAVKTRLQNAIARVSAEAKKHGNEQTQRELTRYIGTINDVVSGEDEDDE